MIRDFISIHVFAKMFDVSVRTVRTWINEEPVFLGNTIHRNQTLCIGSGAIREFERIYEQVDLQETSF